MATNWDPSALGAVDRLRWHFLDSASVTAPSGKASKVANKGSLGTAGDMAQATSTRQPTYSNGVLTTDGSQTYLLTSALTASSVFSSLQTGIFYGIVRYISGSVWFNMEISSGGANRFGAESSARVDWPNGASNNGSAQGFSPNLTTSSVIVVQKTTTNLTIWLNGTQVASIADAIKNTDGTAPIGLGAQNTGNFPGAAEFKGVFGCIDDYSLDTVQRVTGWLAWMMSAAGDSSYVNALPANHPYKAAAPTVTTGGTDATATGATLAAVASLIAGSATGTSDGTAAGATLPVSASLIPGAATAAGNATAAGITLSATASLVPGSASGTKNATAAGATFSTAAAFVPGSASGTAAGNATATGATIPVSTVLLAGSASGTANVTASGATFASAALFLPGAATAASNGAAAGATLSAAPILLPGAAVGGRGATATGATIAASITFLPGSASASVNPYPPVAPDVTLYGKLTGPVQLQARMQPDLITLQARLR